MAFSDTVLSIPAGRSAWATSVALDNGTRLMIDAGLNASTGVSYWYFVAIDPQTGLSPLDPQAGFLAPNDSTGRGEGHVSFTIRANPEVVAGSEIRNRAMITFDQNAPIITTRCPM